MRNLLFAAGFGLLVPYWLGQIAFLVAPSLGLALLFSYWKSWRWLALFLLAFAYSNTQVQVQLREQLRGCDQKLQAQVVVQVQEVVPVSSQATRLVAVVREVRSSSAPASSCQARVHQRYRLTWRAAPELVVGSTWQLGLVLSEPWGYQNPGGFDYERWLLGSGLAATGYVRAGTEVVLQPPKPNPAKVFSLSYLRSKLAAELAGYSNAGVLQALVLGDVSKLDQQTWERLRVSGTVHLFIVSGLHVGLVASAVFFCTTWLLRLLPWLIARYPAQQVAAGLAVLVSGGYVLLAGANVPGVRAWLMLCLALFGLARGRRADLVLAFLWALVIVLLCSPRSGWQQGFYLSFGAVGILIWFFRPRYLVSNSLEETLPKPWLQRLGTGLLLRFKQLLLVQVALVFGMGPLTIALGLATPSLGLLVNLVAVPWVSLVVVPLALLGTISTLLADPLGHLLLATANAALQRFQQFLDLVSKDALWQPPKLAWWAHVLHGCVGLLCLTPLAWRLRLLMFLAYAAILLNWQPPLAKGSFQLLILDVGQGSSILVRTQGHALLFDTGPAYDSGFSAAQALIEPTLGALSVTSLDGLIVSHEDLDHSGGAQFIRQRWQLTLNFQGGLLEGKYSLDEIGPGVEACTAGRVWTWDQVTFELLNPSAANQPMRKRSSNDASCVLRISSVVNDQGVRQQALLFGDISQVTEFALMANLPSRVTIMTAPHHGSATSSSQALVRRLRPQWVVASAARHNRYRHPHPEVVGRYCSVGAQLFVTGEAGAVSWRSDSPQTVELARTQAQPWRSAQTLTELARCR